MVQGLPVGLDLIRQGAGPRPEAPLTASIRPLQGEPRGAAKAEGYRPDLSLSFARHAADHARLLADGNRRDAGHHPIRSSTSRQSPHLTTDAIGPKNMDEDPQFPAIPSANGRRGSADGATTRSWSKTRGLKNPRNTMPTGIPFHADGRTVIREKIFFFSRQSRPKHIVRQITVIEMR